MVAIVKLGSLKHFFWLVNQ